MTELVLLVLAVLIYGGCSMPRCQRLVCGCALMLGGVVVLLGAIPARAGTLTMDPPTATTVPKSNYATWTCPAVLIAGTFEGASPSAACSGSMNQTRVSEWSNDRRETSEYQFISCAPVPPDFDLRDSISCSYRYRSTIEYRNATPLPPATVSPWQGGSAPARARSAYQCPPHAADMGATCQCTAGYQPSQNGQVCEPACSRGQTVSSGYYPLSGAGANPSLIGCKGGCMASFDGTSPAGNSVENGQKVWYAKGKFVNTGAKCTEAANADPTKAVPASMDQPAPPTCGPNQQKGEVNGKVVCVTESGDLKDPTTETKEQSSTKVEKTETTNPDGSKTTTETTTKVDDKGHKEVTVVRTTVAPDGSVSTETETTGTKNPNAPDKGGDGEEGEEKGECEKNPSAAGCGGEAAPVGELYAPKDKTLSGVLGGARDAFASSPVGSAASNFFSVSGTAACPIWTGTIPYIEAELRIDQFCTPFAAAALAMLKGVILLLASFFAFRIAVE